MRDRSITRYVKGSGTANIRVTATGSATLIPFEKQLLQKANKYYQNQEYGVAVVIAHTACEVATERHIGRALDVCGLSPKLKELIKPENIQSHTPKSEIFSIN